ncbi:MAG TPA: nucleotide disphospho-sugar-binding domain-containing protein [Candidatus Eisenbacteria bacterium]|nr:nucleotide disphospho-sugar-binding domain-containing protein [Candidatus Eisenbacteria bacterium]
MRILFCPIGSRGFVYPMIGIAQRLQQREHEVAFATSIDFAGVIAGAGMERLPRGKTDGASFQLNNWGHPLAVAIQVRHVQHAIERFHPDVMLSSTLALGPLIAGELGDVPVAMLGLATYLWPVAVPGGAHRSAEPNAEYTYREMLALYNAARGLFGLSATPGSLNASPLLGSRYLLQTVPLLEPLAEHLPDRVRLVGSCLHELDAPNAELLEWLESQSDSRRLLYVQHGSVFRAGDSFWSGLVTASDELGIRMAASMERHRGAPPAFRDANRLVSGHVPQHPVLEKADGVVCSANTTAVLGALTHGLPLLVFPTGGEQPALAARLLAAGAAAILPAASPVEDLRSALERTLDGAGQRHAVRRLQSAFAELDGPGLVAMALEELAVPAVASGVA